MKKTEAVDHIPQFGLYGEVTSDDPAFVHVENIASRSKDNGWAIQPHRHGRMFQILVIFSGDFDLTLDGVHSRVKAPSVISIPAGVVHGFKFSPDTEGAVLTIAEPMLTNESYARCEPYFGTLFSKARVLPLQNHKDIEDGLALYLNQIESELRSVNSGHKLVAEWLSRSILMQLRRLVADEDADATLEATPVVKYRKLIEKYLLEHWSVEQYANELAVSADHLNRLCKSEVGKTAKAIVQERLLLESKRRLIYTRGSIEELAYSLGFKDAAYFSRFFKQATGETPASYRQGNNFESS